MVNFMPGAQDRLAEASPIIVQTDYVFLNKISEHATEPLSVILQLEPEKLVRPANVPIPRGTRISHLIAKELTVTPVSKSLKLSANVNFTAFTVASKRNEEMVNAEVDGSDPKMIDVTATVKSGHAFVQGISIALDDVAELVEVGSGRVPSGPNDVVVSLATHEKGDFGFLFCYWGGARVSYGLSMFPFTNIRSREPLDAYMIRVAALPCLSKPELTLSR
ncbi:hypothetical protein Tco_0893076 [Tanacetum coccineum]|uniref:Uncharacterized protein n=1 Tax=Tanacetum coccineum TaxID=301880 RepID=A0ABQ5CDY4_9ASTR